MCERERGRERRGGGKARQRERTLKLTLEGASPQPRIHRRPPRQRKGRQSQACWSDSPATSPGSPAPRPALCTGTLHPKQAWQPSRGCRAHAYGRLSFPPAGAWLWASWDKTTEFLLSLSCRQNGLRGAAWPLTESRKDTLLSLDRLATLSPRFQGRAGICARPLLLPCSLTAGPRG